MNLSYLIYQAEHPRSAAEQRAEDTRRGEFAMAVARALRGGRRGGREVSRAAAATRAEAPAGPVLTLMTCGKPVRNW
jgi:hypothetical protein